MDLQTITERARDFPRLFDLALRGELELEAMAGPNRPLDEVNKAFEALSSGRAVRGRVVLAPEAR